MNENKKNNNIKKSNNDKFQKKIKCMNKKE